MADVNCRIQCKAQVLSFTGDVTNNLVSLQALLSVPFFYPVTNFSVLFMLMVQNILQIILNLSFRILQRKEPTVLDEDEHLYLPKDLYRKCVQYIVKKKH